MDRPTVKQIEDTINNIDLYVSNVMQMEAEGQLSPENLEAHRQLMHKIADSLTASLLQISESLIHLNTKEEAA